MTVEYLSEKKHLLKIANDLIAHHAKRTDTARLKVIAQTLKEKEVLKLSSNTSDVGGESATLFELFFSFNSIFGAEFSL